VGVPHHCHLFFANNLHLHHIRHLSEEVRRALQQRLEPIDGDGGPGGQPLNQRFHVLPGEGPRGRGGRSFAFLLGIRGFATHGGGGTEEALAPHHTIKGASCDHIRVTPQHGFQLRI
jgi:hypothetical protein